MSLISRLSSAWRTWFGKSRLERDLDDELRGAADVLRDRYVAQGMSEDAARRAARLELGGEPLKDAVRDVRVGVQIETFVSDARYAVRTLRTSPAFTVAAVASLALGVGANAAIFTFINALLLRPLPVRDAAALVEITAQRQSGHGLISFPMYRDLAARQQVLTGIAATAGETPVRVTLPAAVPGALPGEADNVRISAVSGNYFSILGVDAQRGRLFSPDDDRIPDSAATAGSVVVLSDGFWDRQFGRDPSVVGRTILVRGTPAEVIGITPRGFVGEAIGTAADGWVPLTAWSSPDDLDNRHGTFTSYLGRLAPGVTRPAAQAALTALFQQLLASERLLTTPVEDNAILLAPAAAGLDVDLRRTYLTPLFIVMGIVGLVLLIACANIANLMLARTTARAGEIGVRLALGCSRARLVRQLLTESVVLSIAGAFAGLLVSRWASHSLATLIYRGPVGLRLHLEPDVRVVAFLAALSIATAVVFGLVPAIRATRVDLAPALKGLRRGSGGVTRQRAGRALVVAQVALSLLLLVGAGLLVRSFQKLHQQDFGFTPDRVVIVGLAHNATDRRPAAMTAVAQAARARVLAMPGVQSASLSGVLLFSPSDIGSTFRIPGRPGPQDEPFAARYNSVSPGYFETVGMRLVAGRTIEEHDDVVGAPAVTVVNERMAREFFPGGAIGQTIALTGPAWKGRPVTVVGVVHDAKYNDLREEAKPMFFLPFAQMTRSLRSLEIKTQQPLSAIAGPVREALSSVTKDLMVRNVTTLTEQVDQSLAAERLLLRLCVLFGGLALLLACVGLYGVIAYSVAQRTSEIGLRVALGATPFSVMRGVLRETLLLVVLGIAIGIPAALAAGRLLVTFLYGLTPRDPVSLGLATGILLAASTIAAALPARRAARVDPNVALRHE